MLVCNAGFVKIALPDEAKIEDLNAIINTNLTGVVNTLHVGIPLMKQRSGQAPMSVVIMSSLSALVWCKLNFLACLLYSMLLLV